MNNTIKTEDRVLRFIRENNLFYPGERVVVAVSGGADSVCLLNTLNNLKNTISIDLHIAHLNHKLRGDESDADASYVSKLAKKLHITATIESAEVKEYSKKRKISLEESAREMRYEFFARVIAERDAGCVAVAHTRDDNVETVLLHILRGTGITGLRGLQPQSVLQSRTEGERINVIRPLLEFSRIDIEQYCRELKLKPRFDPSNLLPTFTRNRIRHELIPLLKTYNPRVDDAIMRLSTIAKDEIDFIEEQTSGLWSDIVEEYDRFLSLDVKKLILVPGVLQRQLFRWAVKYLWGDTRDIEAEHVEEMVKFIKKPAGKILQLPHGIRLQKEYGQLVISPSDNAVCPFPALGGEHKIKVPGDTRLPGWLIKTRVVNRPGKSTDRGFSASFDENKTGMSLTVRSYETGDTFQPLGMQYSKSVMRFMSDAKIPGSWRGNIPLVCSKGRIVWVVGWRIDDSVKIDDDTTKVIKIRFERIGEDS